MSLIVLQHTGLNNRQQNLPNEFLPASKSYSRPLFKAGEVTMLRMASKIDDLSNTVQGLMNSFQRNHSSSPVRQSQERFGSSRGNFRQHLYNNILKKQNLKKRLQAKVF